MTDDTTFTGEIHESAAGLPMLPDDRLDALAADIAENGLRHPIILDPDGVLLDGRNRLAACERAGVDPEFVTFDGDPEAVVFSENGLRRHLKDPQVAALEARKLARQGKRKDGRWDYGAWSERSETDRSASKDAVSKCGRLVDLDPTLVDLGRVVKGEALDTVLKEAERRAEKAEQQRQRRTELAEHAPDLLEQVTDTFTLDMAYAAYRERDKKRLDKEREDKESANKIAFDLKLVHSTLEPYKHQEAIDNLLEDWPLVDSRFADVPGLLRASAEIAIQLADILEGTR